MRAAAVQKRTAKQIIRRNWRTFSAGIGIATDALVIAVGFLFAAIVTHQDLPFSVVFQTHVRLLVFSVLVFLFFYTGLGLYRTISQSSFVRQSFNAGRGYVYGAATILSTLFLAGNLFYSRNLLILFLITLPVFYVLSWSLLRKLFARLRSLGYGRWNTLVIGSGPPLASLLRRLETHPQLGYDVVKVIKTMPPSGQQQGGSRQTMEVKKFIEQKRVELIVFSSAEMNGAFDDLETTCRERGIRMRLLSPESDSLFRQTNVYDFAGIPLFVPRRGRVDAAKRVVKRAFDIVGSSIILMFLSPLFFVVAVATKLESRGPVFFKQKRALSDRDKPFEFYKFRSMHHHADEMKETLFRQNESNGALFKMKNDPRLTRVGKLIRRYSIDELPQLFNVLKGEMSLVGPRPLPVGDFRRLKDKDHMGGYFRHRSNAKPGMTGLWQVSGRSNLGFREMILLDLYYIDNQTILFDLEILAQTIPVVFLGKGAY